MFSYVGGSIPPVPFGPVVALQHLSAVGLALLSLFLPQRFPSFFWGGAAVRGQRRQAIPPSNMVVLLCALSFSGLPLYLSWYGAGVAAFVVPQQLLGAAARGQQLLASFS